jgi:NAD(P)-dependent dehydrogenase (short-subunit alcohol dehydrogenase family)
MWYRTPSTSGPIRSILPTIATIGCLAASAAPLMAQGGTAPKAILVTGASSGIGRKITEVLASKGHFVYAGARTEEDIRSLNAIANVQGIRLDVTKPDEIAAAVATVRRGGRGLYGVVNNAGVAILAPLIETDDEDLAFQLDVNVFGPQRITKAFAPLIIESKGRITTIGSINGIVAGPFTGPYAMSKHAVEAFTDALAGEMRGMGVQVSIVEPGRYRSSMSANVLRRWREKNRTTAGSRFETQYQGLVASFSPENEGRYPEPLEVAQAVEHALFDAKPKLRYLVAPTAGQTHAAVRRAIERAVELNERQQFTLDRAALIAMLDAALAR